MIPTPLKIKSIKLASEKAGWIVDELNTIYYSNDYFHTFTATNCGKAEINFSVFNDSTAYGATLSNYSLGIKPIKVDFNPTMVGCALNFDNDGDGYKASVDCDDQDAGINPGKAEIPYNGTNDDCNTATLDDDLDGDGYGIAQDCDDTNIEVNPERQRSSTMPLMKTVMGWLKLFQVNIMNSPINCSFTPILPVVFCITRAA